MCCELEEMAIQMVKNQQRAGGENSQLVRSLGKLILHQPGGLENLLARLRAQGLETELASWISTGTNLPACPCKIRAALGETLYGRLMQRLNLEEHEAERILGEAVPYAINKLTPAGRIEVEQARPTMFSFFSRLLGTC